MTDEMIKEKLSKAFVKTIASYGGYTVTVPEDDYGVDFYIARHKARCNSKNRRLVEQPAILRIQLKSTTEKRIRRTKEGINYELKAKNYNDLVEQRPQVENLPLILIVCVLPDEKEKWLKLDKKYLSLFSEAYYYIAENNSITVDNEESSKTILLREENRIQIDFIDKLYKEFTNV